jgi:hypothetical protein
MTFHRGSHAGEQLGVLRRHVKPPARIPTPLVPQRRIVRFRRVRAIGGARDVVCLLRTAAGRIQLVVA